MGMIPKPFFYPILRLEKVALNGNKNGENTLVDSNVLVTFFLLLMLFHPTYNLIFTVRRNNGSAPSHWSAGSGTIARKALQTLEQLKMVEKDPNGGK